jgi:hypothetical protein
VFDIVGKRNWFFLLSLIITIPGRHLHPADAALGWCAGLKFSIDYTGGTEWSIRFKDENVTADAVRLELANLGQEDAQVTRTGKGFLDIRMSKLDLREVEPAPTAGRPSCRRRARARARQRDRASPRRRPPPPARLRLPPPRRHQRPRRAQPERPLPARRAPSRPRARSARSQRAPAEVRPNRRAGKAQLHRRRRQRGPDQPGVPADPHRVRRHPRLDHASVP